MGSSRCYVEQIESNLYCFIVEVVFIVEVAGTRIARALSSLREGYVITPPRWARLLHSAGDGSSNYEGFEEDCSGLQRRLLNDGAAYTCRRPSISSGSEHSFASSTSSLETPPSQPLQLSNSFVQNGAPPTLPTPPTQSPVQRQSHLASAVKAFPQFVMPSIIQTDLNSANLMRSQWVTQAPPIDDSLDSLACDSPVSFDGLMPSNSLPTTTNSPLAMMEWTSHEVDFSDFTRA